MNIMTDEQKYKLQKAIELIKDSVFLEEETKPRILNIWLSVAGNYCKEIADEIIKEK